MPDRVIYGAGSTLYGVPGVHDLGHSTGTEAGSVGGIPVRYETLTRRLYCNGGPSAARQLARALRGGGTLAIGGQSFGGNWECKSVTADDEGGVTATFRRLLSPFDELPGGWGMAMSTANKQATLTFNGAPKWRWTGTGNQAFEWRLGIIPAGSTGKFTSDSAFCAGVYAVTLLLGGVEIWRFNPLWCYDGVGSGDYTSASWIETAETPKEYTVDLGLTDPPLISRFDPTTQQLIRVWRYSLGFYERRFLLLLRSSLENDFPIDRGIGEDGVARGCNRVSVTEFPTHTELVSTFPSCTGTVCGWRYGPANAAAAVEAKDEAAENGLRWVWTERAGGGQAAGWELRYFGQVHFAITEAGAVVTAANKMGGTTVS